MTAPMIETDGRSVRVRRKRAGTPLTLDYFFQRSIPEPNSGCWLWLNALDRKNGYGVVQHAGRTQRAHRLAFQIKHSCLVPSRLDVCHSCDVRCCVNPDHLFVGTRADNMRDCAKKGRNKTPFSGPGELSPASKLTAQQVAAIRMDGRSQRVLGRAYGVDKGTISHIKRGLTWRSA